jgi:hypothetical protein
MARRYFTLEEANALLPRLREEIAALQAGNQELARQRAALKELLGLPVLNGHAGQALDLENSIADLLRDLGARLDGLAKLGVSLKDLASGLIDFPHWRDGRVVYLCWRYDEAEIRFWHELNAGFQGRQPL